MTPRPARYIPATVLALLATAGALAVTLSSVVNNTADSYNLNGATTYTGGAFCNRNTLIEGNGATINLATAPNEIGIAGGFTLEIRNATIRNGTYGVRTFAEGSTIRLVNVRLEDQNQAVFIKDGFLEMTNSTIETPNEFGVYGERTTIHVNAGEFIGGSFGLLLHDCPLTIDGTTIRGQGDSGMALLQDNVNTPSPLTMTNATLRQTAQYSVNSTGLRTLTIDDCTFENASNAILMHGGTLDASNTDFITHSVDTVILDTGASAVIDNCAFANTPLGVSASGIRSFCASNVSFSNTRGLINIIGVDGAFEGPVVIDGITSDESATARPNKRDGLIILNVPATEIRHADIRGHLIGVSLNNSPTTIEDSSLTRQFRPSINAEHGSHLTLRRSFLEGDLVVEGGQLGVDNYDTVFTLDSDLTVQDCILLDSADNALNCYVQTNDEPSIRIERNFIAGAFSLGINPDHSAPTPHRTWVIRNNTVLNCNLAGMEPGAFDEADIGWNVIGGTGNTSISRNSYNGESKGVAVKSTGVTVRHNAFPWVQGSAIEAKVANEVGGSNAIKMLDNAIFHGTVPFPTKRGILMEDIGTRAALLRNYAAESANDRYGFITDRTRPTQFAHNHLGIANFGSYALLVPVAVTYNAANNWWGAAAGPRINGAGGSGAEVFVTGGSNVTFNPVLTSAPMFADYEFKNAVSDQDFSVVLGNETRAKVSGKTSSHLSAIFAGAKRLKPAYDPFGVLPATGEASKVVGWWDVWSDERLWKYSATGAVDVEIALDPADLPGGVSAASVAAFVWDPDASTWVPPVGWSVSNGGLTHRFHYTGERRPTSILLIGGFSVGSIPAVVVGQDPTFPGADANGDSVVDAADVVESFVGR